MSRSAPWRTARRTMNLHTGKDNTWYRIVRNQVSGPVQLHIFDEIGYFGFSADDLIRDLADINGPVEVHLNSPGGEVNDGITIYNTLMARPDVTVVIDGMAASIASVIACAGNPTVIARTGEMMIHEAFTQCIGDANDLRQTADRLDRATLRVASIYAERTGKPEAYWRQLMKAETWFSAEEALEAGLVDRITESGTRQVRNAREQWDLGVYRNAASVPYVGTRESRHMPMTGTHTHDHGAHGAGDADDGMHSHRHTHNNDASHDPASGGHSHNDGDNVEPGHSDPQSDYDSYQAALLNHVLDERFTDILNWDAAAALKKCKSASDFRSICAGERSDGKPDTESHWALPHHDSPGGPPDKQGVIAALGRINQTDGLKNKSAALSHLKAHARALGLPSGDEKDSIRTWADEMSFSDEEVLNIFKSLKGA